MLARMRTALKFLTYGILIGVFFAPRSGAETRRQLRQWAGSMAADVRGALGMGGGTTAAD